MHDDHVLESRNNVTLLVKSFSFLTHCTAVNDIFLLLELVLKIDTARFQRLFQPVTFKKQKGKTAVNGLFLVTRN